MKRIHVLLIMSLIAVAVMLWAPGCDDLITEVNEITEAGHPTADFSLDTASIDSGCAPLTVTFIDQSNGPRDEWLWDFGDGDTSSDTNPTHTYDSAGTYTVKLTIRDNRFAEPGTDTEVKNRFIIVGTAVADYSVSTDRACIDEDVQFTLGALGGVDSVKWKFGDGSGLIADSNPVHAFDNAGVYSCTLLAWGPCGMKEVVRDSVIRITACPIVGFYADTTTVCLGQPIQFFDTTTWDSGFVGREWLFGDGNNSFDENPIHNYTTAGIYTVTLTWTGATGDGLGAVSTDSIEDYITVYDTGSVAVGALSQTTSCFNPLRQFQVLFEAQQLGDIDSIRWSFGDGTFFTDTTQPPLTPVHAYTTPGRYTVVLEAWGPCYSGTVFDSAFNFVSLCDTLSGVVFEIHPDTAVADTSLGDTSITYTFVDVTDTIGGANVILSREWNFGDGSPILPDNDTVQHKFEDTGTFEVKLTAINDCGQVEYVDTIEIVEQLTK